MKELVSSGNVVTFNVALLEFIKDVFKGAPTPESAVADLNSFAEGRGRTSTSNLANANNVTSGEVKELLAEMLPKEWQALAGAVEDLGLHESKRTIMRSAGKPANVMSCDLGATATASIEADTDGEILDGLESFAKDQEVFVRIGVTGSVKNVANVGGALGGAGGKLAFGNNATITIENFFRHKRGESAISALIRDFSRFTLPGILNGVPAHWGAERPAQLIRLAGSGSVKLTSNFAWQRAITTEERVVNENIDVDAKICLGKGISAVAIADFLLEGDFDIIIGPDRQLPKHLLVRLNKRRSTATKTSFQVGAGIQVTGLDRVARVVMAALVEPMDLLFGVIEENLQQYSNLRELIDERGNAAIGDIWKTAVSSGEVLAWLKAIDSKPALKKTLIDLAAEAGIKIAEPLINEAGAAVTQAVDALGKLVSGYDQAKKRIFEALERAVSLELGVAFERAAEHLATEETVLEVALEGRVVEELLPRILVGDFSEIVGMDDRPGSGVEIRGGYLKSSGLRSIKKNLAINALGLKLQTGSVLLQDWECEVSVTGGLVVAIKGCSRATASWWGGMRAAAFLADARVVTTLAKSGLAAGISSDSRVSMELVREWEPSSEQDLADYEATLRDLGLMRRPAKLASDLILSSKKNQDKHRYGKVRATGVAEFTGEALKGIVRRDEFEVRRAFAEQLSVFGNVSLCPFLLWRDNQAVPFLIWKSVESARAAGKLVSGQFLSHLVFPSDDGSVRQRISNQAQWVQFCRYAHNLRLVADLFRALHQFQERPMSPSASREEILDHLRSGHRRLLQLSGRLLSQVTGGGTIIETGRCLMGTLLQLADAPDNEARFVVFQQLNADGRVFVYQ